MSKSIFSSKTFYLGLAAVLAGAGKSYFSEHVAIEDYFMLVQGTLVIINRFFTNRNVHVA